MFIDIADLAPQFRSVHYKAALEEGEPSAPQDSSVSIIASLRAADATFYRHASKKLEIPDIAMTQRTDLAHLSLQNLKVKMRQGLKVLGSVVLGDLESSINAHEIQSLSTSIDQWLSKAKELSSAMDTINRQRICKSRNLVAAFVVAGDKYGITNDPPFLTRPSHVLRISKNLLRVDDSWKISTRVRHIARSLPPEVKEGMEREFVSSTTCDLDSMDPVMTILSRWRSWELSNIQESFFVKWLSGESGQKKRHRVEGIPIEGVIVLEKVTMNLDVKDCLENSVTVLNAVLSCTESRESSKASAAMVMGVDVDCESITMKTDTDAIDLFKVISHQISSLPKTEERSNPSTHQPSDSVLMEYRGTVLLRQIDIGSQFAHLALAFAARELRVSGFSQLRHEDINSPSFCLSVQQIGIALREEPRMPSAAVRLTLERFSSQMMKANEKPGVAASLGSLWLKLTKPVPWFITEVTRAAELVKSSFPNEKNGVTSPPQPFQKPNLATVTFRLHHATVELWLVPDALLLNLESGGLQAVIGELNDGKQWAFFDVPPATLSILRAGMEPTKFADIQTPFIATKTLMRWDDGLCVVDPDVQVGTFSVSVKNLVTLFQTLTSPEVSKHIRECEKVVKAAQEQLAGAPIPAPSEETDHRASFLSYRLHAFIESIEVRADTPDANLVFACSGIKMSLSNRTAKAPSAQQRILFTAGSQSTSLSVLSPNEMYDKISIMDMHWEVGNSINTNVEGDVQYSLYLVSNTFLVTLSPQAVEKGSHALHHIIQEVDALQVKKTLKDLEFVPSRPQSRRSIAPVSDSVGDDLRLLQGIEAVRVSLRQIQFKWVANGWAEDSHGFTFKLKSVDASVLEKATKGRFVVEEGDVELNSRGKSVSHNYARLPKLDFNVHRRTEADGWQLQLDAHGDTVQVNFTPTCIETGHAVLESISTAAASLREDFPSRPNTPTAKPLAPALFHQTQKLKSVVTSIDFSGARINAQYDEGSKPTSYMSKYRVRGDGCDVGAMQIPGLALRSRFSRKPRHVFHAEICILESKNVLSPQVKPFIHDILRRIERVMSHRTASFREASNPSSAPSTAAILGDLKFSVGLRVQSQELTLTCDPFAKVDANVGVDEIYATLISCKTPNHNQTFAMAIKVSGAHASLQHHYSGIASAKIRMNDLNMSIFNNNQIQSTEIGISAILKSSALEVSLNARQGNQILTLQLISRPRFPHLQLSLARKSTSRHSRRTPPKTPLKPHLNATTPKSNRLTTLLPNQHHLSRQPHQFRPRSRSKYRNHRPRSPWSTNL